MAKQKRKKHQKLPDGTIRVSDETGTSIVFTPQLEFPCGFCGGTLTAGVAEGDVPMIIHTMPMCTEFETIEEPTAFLAANRKKLGIPLPEAN